jgi:hypothetical protein
MIADATRTAGEPQRPYVRKLIAPVLPDRLRRALAWVTLLSIVYLASCASRVRQNNNAELDRVVDQIVAEPAVRAEREMPTLGDLVYVLIYEAHGTTPKPSTISNNQLRSGLLADPGAVVRGPWIWRVGRSNQKDAKPHDIVRLYFNLNPDHAVAAVDRLTTELNQAHLRFIFKTASTVVEMQRSSSAVLYVDRSDYQVARRVATATSKALPESFADSCVPFTKRITRGVSAADQPDAAFAPKTRPEHSFGTFVSDVLAEALLALPQNAPPASVVAEARRRLCAYGVDPDRPYLRRGHTVDDL